MEIVRIWGKGAILFDCDGRKFVGITEADIRMWSEAYPMVDIGAELAKMVSWIVANPSRGRKSNYGRFINNWLAKSQDAGHRPGKYGIMQGRSFGEDVYDRLTGGQHDGNKP